jgi:hypothetical protein
MRRTFIIIAIIIVVLGLGVVAYLYYVNRTPAVVVTPQTITGLPTSGGAVPSSPDVTTPAQTTPSPVNVPPRLVKISAGPVVPGMAVIDVKGTASTTSDVITKYIERQSGNIFSYQTMSRTLTRTSNKTIPGIQSAAWLPDASFAYTRYLSDSTFSTINTYAIAADGATGFFLPQNLAGIATASTSILTLASGVNGSTASVSRTDGTKATTAFSTAFTALRASFAGKSQYLAFTKPSSTLDGYAFLIDSRGRFSRIAGPLQGLVALSSPSGKWILVSYTLDQALQMELVNTSTGETIGLPIGTIADKCTWALDDSAVYCGVPTNAPSAAYPDDWYQGAVHLSDRIWKIQVAGRYAQLVLDFTKETQLPLDLETPALDPQTTTLVFVNKNDGSLWSYSL